MARALPNYLPVGDGGDTNDVDVEARFQLIQFAPGILLKRFVNPVAKFDLVATPHLQTCYRAFPASYGVE